MKQHINTGLIEKLLNRNFIRLLKKRAVMFIILFFSYSLFGYSQNNIHFFKIGVEEGLSQLSVMTIYQDELGSMWFGTREGLNLYNGTTMKVLQPKSSGHNSLSGNLIKKISGDFKGSIFILTQNGLDRFDLKTGGISNLIKMQIATMNYGNDNLWYGKDNKVYFYSNEKGKLFCEIDEDAQIDVILPVSGDKILLGTISSGVYEVDRNKNIRKILSDCSHVSSIYEDSQKNIWVSTWENGLYRIKGNQVINYRQYNHSKEEGLSSDFVRAVCEDHEGNMWIGTKQGLDKFDREKAVFYHYNSEAHDERSLSHNSVWSLFKDRYNNIWVGTYFGGINYFSLQKNVFTPHNLTNGVFANKPFPIISQIIPYKENKTFLCTEGNGLLVYDILNKTYTVNRELEKDNIKTAYLDTTNQTLFLGLHLGGLCVLDLTSNKLKRYSQIMSGLDQSNIVRKILPWKGKYLVATHNGLYLFDKQTEEFSVFSPELHKHVTYFVDIIIDKENYLWIASRGVYKYNIDTQTVQTYFPDPNNIKSISSHNALRFYIDSANNLWIATGGGGINRYNKDSDDFTRFTTDNTELRNDYVINLIESPQGYLYLATTQGLSYLNLNNNEVTNLTSRNGFPLNSLYNGGINMQPNGEIFVAGMNGMVSFYEESVLEKLKPINIFFTNLWVNNQEIIPDAQSKLLITTLPFAKGLKFNYKQSILKFEFASDNIVRHNHYQYMYRVKELSQEWISLKEGVNEINFMNLNPGSYVLELKAVSPNSKEELGRTELSFRVTPPFYKSVFAYILYCLIVLFSIWLYIRYVKYKIRLESSLEYEKKEKQYLEEVNQAKQRFFTNISHEFRTPLTLITSQVDMLLQDKKMHPDVHNRISSIGRNSSLMKHLINELLDFRKVDSEKLRLKVGECNIVQFVHEIYLSFEEYANYKKIDFRFETSDDTILVWFDQNQMQKVFYNLISNAFKYTSQNGKIYININQKEETVHISVLDTGIGIASENIDNIFNRYYQIDNKANSTYFSVGTGLGLALTKSIVELHHAEINVTSEVSKGSRFEVILLKGSSHFSEDELTISESPDDIFIKQIEDFLPQLESAEVTKNISEEKNTILIVEDNEELLDVLKTVFESSYNVITAVNGEEGLSKTIEYQPDIVLSDLVMPIMTGNEMCLKIKNNFSVCHIPVVLLTVETAAEHNIEGLKYGADDYITKPFDIAMLLHRCNNLINGRKLLQEKFAKSVDLNVKTIAHNEIDLGFIEKAHKIIEDNFENPDFGIKEFSRAMNLGRTNLFNKIKAITGQTPNDFIITLKMKKASYLLINNPELNISDIAYKLGFNSPKYFSKCFKDHFAHTPSEYRSLNLNS